MHWCTMDSAGTGKPAVCQTDAIGPLRVGLHRIFAPVSRLLLTTAPTFKGLLRFRLSWGGHTVARSARLKKFRVGRETQRASV